MNNTIKIIIWLVVIVVVVWGAYILFKGTPEAESGVIKIGSTMPMTGEAASFGEGGKAGVELALKEINEAGGINGRQIEVVYEDDKCSKDGVTTISKLVNIDKVVAIIGPACSAAGGPGLPVAQEAKVPVIFWASAPHLTKVGDYVFRAYPSDAFQGKFAADYVFNKLKKKKVALLYVKNDWGQGIRDVFVEGFKELGGEVVYDEGISQDTKDLKSFISKLKTTNPDLIYFPAYPALGVIGLKQMKDLGVNVPVLGGDAFETDEVIKSEVAEGVTFTVGVIRNPEDFKARVKETTGAESNLVTSVAYDAIKILAEIIGEVGTDRKKIKKALEGFSYTDGISLPLIKFGPDHELTEAQFEVKVIKGGKTETLPQ